MPDWTPPASSARPKAIDRLAAAPVWSRKSLLRKASLQKRYHAAAFLYLGALVRRKKPLRAFFQARKTILRPRHKLQARQFFNPNYVARDIGGHGRMLRTTLFANWCAHPGVVATNAWFKDIPNAETRFATYEAYLLDGIWKGLAPHQSEGETPVGPAYHKELEGFIEFAKAIDRWDGFLSFDKIFPQLDSSLLDFDAKELARTDELKERMTSGKIAELAAKAAQHEPLIQFPNRENAVFTKPPMNYRRAALGLEILHREAELRTAKAVVVIPHCRMSGAARVAGIVASTLCKKYGPEEVVVIRTDLDDLQYPEWFPDGVRHLALAGRVADVDPAIRRQTLFHLLRSLGPEVIFNVNSRLFWDCTTWFATMLREKAKVYAYMFCTDINARGHEAGYPVEFYYRAYDLLDGMITDSDYLKDRMQHRFMPPDGAVKMQTLRTPLTDPPKLVSWPDTETKRRPRIYWAGRFDRQKRIDLVYALAARMPDVDFHLWGAPVLDDPTKDLVKPANIAMHGSYSGFESLPLSECDAWLYTAAWDGVPTILLDIAAAGLPLVCTRVGGTPEALEADLSWGIDDVEDLAAYETALREILADLPAARAKAAQMSDRIRAKRTEEAYAADLFAFMERT